MHSTEMLAEAFRASRKREDALRRQLFWVYVAAGLFLAGNFAQLWQQ